MEINNYNNNSKLKYKIYICCTINACKLLANYFNEKNFNSFSSNYLKM